VGPVFAVAAAGTTLTAVLTAPSGAAATCAPIYVSASGTQTSPAKLLEFASGANGNVAPANTIGGPRNSKMVTASGIAQDSNGFTYVVSPHINTLNVYAPGASGDVAPFATLSGVNPGLNNPQGIVVRNGKLYVANGPFGGGLTGSPSIAVFALPLAAGVDNVAPVAVIAGPATGLISPFGLALDSSGNIFVANVNNTITEYAPPTPSSYASPDNAAPILTISTGPSAPEGIAIHGNTLYSANDNNTITEYSLPSGAVINTISGANTRLAQPLGIDVDSSGNLYVVNTGTAGNQVLEFAPGATGNAAPIAVISGPATLLDSAQFVFITPCSSRSVRRPPADFDGDGKTDVSVFRPATSGWYVHESSGADTTTTFGTSGDIPVPADYDGNATTDIAVFRPSTGTWYVRGGLSTTFGTVGDIPVPGDYDGNGSANVAVFRPSTGTWYIQGGATVGFGTTGDIPVPGDYDGNGTTDIAVFRPSTGTWYVRGGLTVAWGTTGDIPQPGDYNGDGTTDIAVFRPSTGTWYVRGGVTIGWGASDDIPLPLPDAIRRFFFTPLRP